jgi:methionyl-tRNA synthetase
MLATAWDRLARIAMLVVPAIPGAAQNLWEQLGLAGRLPELAGDDLEEALGFRPGPDAPTVTPGVSAFPRPAGGLRAGSPLFPRLDRKKALARLAEPEPAEAAQEEKTVIDKPSAETPGHEGLLSIEQFMGVDLRTARVLECERVEGTDKLLRLVVDIGSERRQLVAGVAQVYSPQEMIGRSIVVVANLKPAKVRGVQSQGMLLAADSGDGPRLVEVPEAVAPGTRVR